MVVNSSRVASTSVSRQSQENRAADRHRLAQPHAFVRETSVNQSIDYWQARGNGAELPIQRVLQPGICCGRKARKTRFAHLLAAAIPALCSEAANMICPDAFVSHTPGCTRASIFIEYSI